MNTLVNNKEPVVNNSLKQFPPPPEGNSKTVH